jgi:hypothetical protein
VRGRGRFTTREEQPFARSTLESQSPFFLLRSPILFLPGAYHFVLSVHPLPAPDTLGCCQYIPLCRH